jgi:hypothetical protein
MAIYDLDDEVIYSSAFALRSGETATATIQIDCVTGWRLSGEVVAGVTIEARHGSAGGWTDIETTPIDLSTWNGSRETFEIRFTAGTITSFSRKSFTLTVSR